ncbi:hypothetical protein DFJ73DRAFT_785782 [Zopfochytrium polystomum]|nr:hypothetical protein DFJ73DRAFT_785782 [Zopfochytrium polystomum]
MLRSFEAPTHLRFDSDDADEGDGKPLHSADAEPGANEGVNVKDDTFASAQCDITTNVELWDDEPPATVGATASQGRRRRRQRRRVKKNQVQTEECWNGVDNNGSECRDPVVKTLLRGVFLSRTSPLRVLRGDRDALALILQSHRDRNLSPFIDWSVYGFANLGRCNHLLSSGTQIDGDPDESDGGTEGQEAEKEEAAADRLQPPPLLPPPLVRGLTFAHPPIARRSAQYFFPGLNSDHKNWGCSDFSSRWSFEYWWRGFPARLTTQIRREMAAQWACFEEYVLKEVGWLSPQEWERAEERAKQSARERVMAEVDARQEMGSGNAGVESARLGGSSSSPPSSRLASLLAAAEEEARLHALVTEALDPRLVEPFHVSMLPIEMGHYCSLPLKCRRYSGLIDLCLLNCPDEVGKVGYLTIDERWLEPGETQLRPGLHIEANFDDPIGIAEDPGSNSDESILLEPEEWGADGRPAVSNIKGGLFQASNVSGSCRVWDCVLRDPRGVMGPLGSVENLRSLLNRGAPASLAFPPIPAEEPAEPRPSDPAQRRPAQKRDAPDPTAVNSPTQRGGATLLAAHEPVWMTYCTPREALPVRERVFSQFFRLVTSRVTVWCAAHSTRNDEVAPPPNVRVVDGEQCGCQAPWY